ncbi:hemerythrin domain-containing protein [Nocardia blacklockiae]|uniref:hemerythrin domain-containing protein n=1 Tax=Nocardia blacklockiae TaxID=480036 RepID=UPI0018963B24|nr:hemerythrin domain-containing protein [Nocardia blacklockiae]MBF6175788.1 hemerythrin domain-containing protein [Nocardia blacklockiae]
MDALNLLRADHESVLGMLETLERGRGFGDAETAAREKLVTSLVIAESQHEAVEEQFFWPWVRDVVPDGDALADHAIAQEDAAKQLLQRLDECAAGSVDFEDALTRFIPAAREHIDFEQSRVWPRVREFGTPDQLEGLGEKMAAAKQTAPTRPHPNTPSTPGALKTGGLVAAVLDKARDLVSHRRDQQPPNPPPA